MKYWRYGVEFPGYGLYWQTGDPLAGMEDDDIITAGEFRQALAMKEGQLGEALELRELVKKPDFEVVVKNHWPKVRDADPTLSRAMTGMNRVAQAVFAYKMGMTDPEYQAKKTKPPQNEPLPNPRLRAASSAAVIPQGQDKAYWDNLPDDKFDEVRGKMRGRTQGIDVGGN